MDETEFQRLKKLHFQGSLTGARNRRGHTWVVYGLADPRDGTVRYVGVTNSLLGRLNEHMRMYGGNVRKNAWLQELKDVYMLPHVVTLEVIEDDTEWREREVAWIQAYLDFGADLLNEDMPAKAQEGA